jgi:hypothetical protein|tara:strand:+ start:911 stop:1222 length:312 start_codon:yes stop_codon:yes gene_type:complete
MDQGKKFSEGDLVQVCFSEVDRGRQWTLCSSHIGTKTLSECVAFDENVVIGPEAVYTCMKGELGLITKIVLNKLDQPLLYELKFSAETLYCKSILADKYLRKL